MSDYIKNGKDFHWGPRVTKLNPEKALLLKKYAVGKCLDIGFGSGVYTKYLKTLGHEVVGVDNESEFVRQAKKTYPGIKFIHGSVSKLPFQENEFDTIILFDVLEHVDEKSALKEIARVGKRMIITVPHQNQKILLKYGLAHAHNLDKTHLRNYTVKSLKNILLITGWHPVSVKPVLPISLSGILITNLCKGKLIFRLILKIILKPFLPEPPIFSTVFALGRSLK